MITKDAIETAYSFLHQKRRVYEHSSIANQRDDIEYAIASYVRSMNADLYLDISGGKADFLMTHATFAQDIAIAEERLEALLFQ